MLSLFSMGSNSNQTPQQNQQPSQSVQPTETHVDNVQPLSSVNESFEDWSLMARSSSTGSETFEVVDQTEPSNDIEFEPTSLSSSLVEEDDYTGAKDEMASKRHRRRQQQREVTYIPIPRRKKSDRAIRKQLQLISAIPRQPSSPSNASLVARAFAVVSDAVTKLHVAATRPRPLSKIQTRQKYSIPQPVRKEKARSQANYPSRKYNRKQ